MGGDAGGGARWARCGRRRAVGAMGAMRAGSREQRVGDGGAVGAGPGLGRWDESEAEERAES